MVLLANKRDDIVLGLTEGAFDKEPLFVVQNYRPTYEQSVGAFTLHQDMCFSGYPLLDLLFFFALTRVIFSHKKKYRLFVGLIFLSS